MERKAFNSLNESVLQVQLDEVFGFEKSEKKKKSKAKAKASETETVGFGFSAKEVPVRRSRITGRKIRKKKEKIRIVSPQDFGSDTPSQFDADETISHKNEAVLEYFNNYFGDNLNEDTSDEDIMQAVYDLIDLTEAVLDVVEGSRGLKRTQRRIQNYNPRRDLDPKTYRKMGGADTARKKQEYELEQRPKEFALRQMHRASAPGAGTKKNKDLGDTAHRVYDTSTYHPIKKHQRGILSAIAGKEEKLKKIVHAAGRPAGPSPKNIDQIAQYRGEREHARDFGHEHLGSERKGLDMLTIAKHIEANPELEKRFNPNRSDKRGWRK